MVWCPLGQCVQESGLSLAETLIPSCKEAVVFIGIVILKMSLELMWNQAKHNCSQASWRLMALICQACLIISDDNTLLVCLLGRACSSVSQNQILSLAAIIKPGLQTTKIFQLNWCNSYYIF